MFNLADLEAARAVVAGAMAPTPQYRWPGLGRAVGAEVWVKHENHTPIGSFKVRGGLVYLQHLKDTGQLPKHIVTATRGNHGQSIPYAAQRHGVPVTVFVPHGNSREKNAAMRGWGAELIEFGKDFDVARLEAERHAEKHGALFVPAFHPVLTCGVATYAWELLHAVPNLDALYVSIGMGSSICAAIRTRDLLGLSTEVIGVVAAGAPAMAQSFAAGHVVETETAATFADGMACRVPMPSPLAIIRAGAARVVKVSDAEIAAAMRILFQETHNVAEGAGAAAFAALMAERERQADRRVAVVLSGGNIDKDVFAAVLAGGNGTAA